MGTLLMGKYTVTVTMESQKNFFSSFSLIHLIVLSGYLYDTVLSMKCYDVTDAEKEWEPCMGISSLGGCKNGSSDPDPTEIVKPQGVAHCREQFRYFPCCVLETTKNVEEVPCDRTINRQFTDGGHFSCADLLEKDPDALFFFIKESATYDSYQCITVCNKCSGFQTTSLVIIALWGILIFGQSCLVL